MNKFTVEETNLISIYMSDTRRELVEEMTGALPYMDEDMRELAQRTITKLNAVSETEYMNLSVYSADDEGF